jgi:hypothetical protein
MSVVYNGMWRHHRSELRPPHSDSKYGHKGERNVCYVLIVSYAMCHINLVKFLTNPMTTYVVQIKILTTSWD